MFEKRQRYLSARQFLVPGLTDLSEDDLEEPPRASIVPFVLSGIALAFALSALAFVR